MYIQYIQYIQYIKTLQYIDILTSFDRLNFFRLAGWSQHKSGNAISCFRIDAHVPSTFNVVRLSFAHSR